MNTKIFTAIILFTSIICFSQKTNNIGFGISPFGGAKIKLSYPDDYKVSAKKGKLYANADYKEYLNAHLFYEKQFKGISTLFEAKYSKAKLDQIEIGDLSEIKANEIDEDLTTYCGNIYIGYAINKGKRLQIPLYIGGGLSALVGEPMTSLSLQLSAKARIKFYISNKISIYSGINYDLGLPGESDGPSGSYTLYNVDTGIMFSF